MSHRELATFADRPPLSGGGCVRTRVLRPVASKRLPRAFALALFLGAIGATGCVRQDVHDQSLRELAAARGAAMRLDQQVASLRSEASRMAAETAARDARIAESDRERAELAARASELEAQARELGERLRTAGDNVELLANERSQLSRALSETRAQLAALESRGDGADQAALDELRGRLAKLADAGRLKVVLRGGRLLVELPNDVLFASGRSEVSADGRAAVLEVAKALASLQGRRFQVAGHTDTYPIKTKEFPSNWELSNARALAVVKLLIEKGVKPESLSAAGYAEFDPAQSNGSPTGRAKNRRIEIVLVPNIEELVKIPELRPATPPKPPTPPPTTTAPKPPTPATPPKKP